MDYYASYKNSKDPSLLRKELVSYALKYGNKKAAQQFQTTVKTVRKWRKRWQEKKGAGLKDRSKKPEKSPRMMKMYWQFKIKALAEKATADNKRINGAMIKREYSIPYNRSLYQNRGFIYRLHTATQHDRYLHFHLSAFHSFKTIWHQAR